MRSSPIYTDVVTFVQSTTCLCRKILSLLSELRDIIMNEVLFYVLISPLLLILALFGLSTAVPGAGFYARCGASIVSLLICALYGVTASAILRCVGYSGLSQWTTGRSFKWTMRFTTGLQFKIENEEHLRVRPAVFIGNHQTSVCLFVFQPIETQHSSSP